MFYLGIDVSKGKLDCALLDAAKDKIKSKVVTNDIEGFSELQRWLKKQKAEVPHVVMGPTGVYHEPAAFFFSDAGLTVSFVNPSQIRSFAQGIGVKTKTDKKDSEVLARFGNTQKPEAWIPPPASARTLKALLARRDAVADDLQREKNRQEKLVATETPPLVLQSIDASIKFLNDELKRLQKSIDDLIDKDPDLREKKEPLETIPDVGKRVSDHITALLAARSFERAEQLAAYRGFVPVQRELGSSVRGRPRMSKAGPAHRRKLLYMPKMAAIGAAMRKLAHLCFGVVKTGRACEANFAFQA